MNIYLLVIMIYADHFSSDVLIFPNLEFDGFCSSLCRLTWLFHVTVILQNIWATGCDGFDDLVLFITRLIRLLTSTCRGDSAKSSATTDCKCNSKRYQCIHVSSFELKVHLLTPLGNEEDDEKRIKHEPI